MSLKYNLGSDYGLASEIVSVIINYVETYKFTIANTNMYKHKNKRTQNLY